jgi:hypothetical protein
MSCCLSCQSLNPKFCEETSKKNVFCSLDCQKLYYIDSMTSQKDTDITILLNLPLKELFQMRTVSKYYQKLIDSDEMFFSRLMAHYKNDPKKVNREFVQSMRGKWSPEKIEMGEYVWGIKTEIESLDVLERLSEKTYFDPSINNFVYVRSAIYGDEISIFKKLLEFPSVINGADKYLNLLIDDEKYEMLAAILPKLPKRKRNFFEQLRSAAIGNHKKVYELLYKYTLPLTAQQENILSIFSK